MSFKTRIRGMLARSQGSSSTPSAPSDLTLTKEEIAVILAVRFQKQVEQDGAPTALWRTIIAEHKNTRAQVLRVARILAVLQISLTVGLGVLILL